jgi:hypothetical protein
LAAQLTKLLLYGLLVGGCLPVSDASGGENAAVADGTATDRTILGGSEATLIAQGDACLLRRNGQPDTPLAPAPPCRFLRAEGRVQQHAYPDRGVDAVVLVIGSAADPAQKTHFGAAATAECGTVAHGLIVRGNKVTAARQVHRGGMFCVEQGRDEKDFYAVAHE